MKQHFADKDEARQAVWDRLQAERLARFPFPPHGRILNFAGARYAAQRLFEVEPWRSALCLKINPDAPQRPVRELALRRGITVFVPTPRLRGDFRKLDPARIAPDQISAAASLSKGARCAEEVALARECGALAPDGAWRANAAGSSAAAPDLAGWAVPRRPAPDGSLHRHVTQR